MSHTATTVVRGACPHDCPDTCSLLTTVENGRAVKVQGNPEHPLTDGVLCAKVSRYTERTYHPERILTPLRRIGPKGSGQFEPVGWDEALDDIAARLAAIAARDPQAILPYSYAGTMGLIRKTALIEVGVPEIRLTNRTRARAEAIRSDFGAKVTVQEWVQAPAMLEGAATVVNTTALGMTGKSDFNVPLETLPSTALVTDIVYTPLMTQFLIEAQDKGCTVVDGLGMLLHQAAPGFERWFGQRPEVDEATRAAVLSA